jgi:ATP-dependent DNA helicase RecG
MTPDMLQRIFAEAGPDCSAEICAGAATTDLDVAAIDVFRRLWAARSGNAQVETRPVESLLRDAELLLPGGLTYAALILLGTTSALGRLLAQAEVVFEYRSSTRPGPAQQREEFRAGFLAYDDRIWQLVNSRNDLQHYQERFVMHAVPTFDEVAVREALLNAVSHRDYRHPGSVFVRQFPRRIEVVSPGGFPPGITADNVLDQQLPRNRRIAETFARCGLVERSGQGVDRIVVQCVRQGKPLPDFSASDAHRVALRLDGEIGDEAFLKFLERVGDDALDALDSHDFVALSQIAAGVRPGTELSRQIQKLVEAGLVERTGHGKPVLAKRYYGPPQRRSAKVAEREAIRKGRKRAVSDHLAAHDGRSLQQLVAAFPDLTRNQLQSFLKLLRAENAIHPSGATRAARWFPGPSSPADE